MCERQPRTRAAAARARARGKANKENQLNDSEGEIAPNQKTACERLLLRAPTTDIDIDGDVQHAQVHTKIKAHVRVSVHLTRSLHAFSCRTCTQRRCLAASIPISISCLYLPD